jgi:hypothetical protein
MERGLGSGLALNLAPGKVRERNPEERFLD